jgi:hypothetical protein
MYCLIKKKKTIMLKKLQKINENSKLVSFYILKFGFC